MEGNYWWCPQMEATGFSTQQVVEKLAERGHKVVVLAPEVSWQMGTPQAYTVKTHPVSLKSWMVPCMNTFLLT